MHPLGEPRQRDDLAFLKLVLRTVDAETDERVCAAEVPMGRAEVGVHPLERNADGVCNHSERLLAVVQVDEARDVGHSDADSIAGSSYGVRDARVERLRELE